MLEPQSKKTSKFSPIRGGTAGPLGIGQSVGEEFKAHRLDMFFTSEEWRAGDDQQND